jgi:O-acetyl-ADP-ribose deacetylase
MIRIPDPETIREDKIKNSTIKIIRGDVAKIGSAAIVCPTNSCLAQNSGLTEYLRGVAGRRVLFELKSYFINPLNPGEIIVTSAGDLPANYLFNCCIPDYTSNNSNQFLRLIILKILEKCEDFSAGTVLIPCLPTASYGFSPSECASVYWDTVFNYILNYPETIIKEVKFVTLDKEATDLFIQEAEKYSNSTKKSSFFDIIFKKNQKLNSSDIELK